MHSSVIPSKIAIQKRSLVLCPPLSCPSSVTVSQPQESAVGQGRGTGVITRSYHPLPSPLLEGASCSWWGFFLSFAEEYAVNAFFLLLPGPTFQYFYTFSSTILHVNLSSLMRNLLLHPDLL